LIGTSLDDLRDFPSDRHLEIFGSQEAVRTGKASTKMSVWDDIADDAAEAENLKLRAALIRAIRSRVDETGWSQTAAAQNLGITQPRLSDLYRGKISKFSLDALVEIASKLRIHVRVEVEPNFVVPSGT